MTKVSINLSLEDVAGLQEVLKHALKAKHPTVRLCAARIRDVLDRDLEQAQAAIMAQRRLSYSTTKEAL